MKYGQNAIRVNARIMKKKTLKKTNNEFYDDDKKKMKKLLFRFERFYRQVIDIYKFRF